MEKLHPTVATQIAKAARALRLRRTGRVPKEVTVVLSGSRLVVELHEALSPSEAILVEKIPPAAGATLEEALPQMLESVLAPFQEVGVQWLLARADLMVRGGMAEPPYVGPPDGRN